ncbi:TPX2 (targeting protein for Xklp2) protein family isoform X2 [Wolffia australiana]
MASSQSVLGSPGSKTPKRSQGSRSLISVSKMSENCDPNLNQRGSPAKKSAKAKKSAAKLPSSLASSPTVVRERKFILVNRKTSSGVEKNADRTSCRQAAYEALRASQDNFFRVDRRGTEPERSSIEDTKQPQDEEEPKERIADEDGGNEASDFPADSDHQDLKESSKIRKLRSLMLEKAVNSMPVAGSGRVLHLVKAFENLLSISTGEEPTSAEANSSKVLNWPLPGLHPPSKLTEARSTSASVEFSFPPKEFDGDSKVYASFDAEDGRLSFETKASEAGRKSRRSSSDSLRSSWNNKLKVTRQKPFKLRTEQRGRLKEEHFFNKVKEMLQAEEKKRIPIAQGLPWTTDEPESLAKPPVKETTEPVDLVLHSDVRAAERAAFDNFVAERLTLVEKMKMEREQQRKIEEEEEIKRLRKELVPIAQPMPYFDRPFIPKRSSKPQTVPKEPKFYVRPHRPCLSDEVELITFHPVDTSDRALSFMNREHNVGG